MGIRDDQDQVALPCPGALDQRLLRLGSEELRDRALDLATDLECEIGEALRSESTGAIGQFVDLATGDAGHPGRHDRLDPAARRKRRIEDAEARCRDAVRTDERRREVDELHREPDVGLVRAEAFKRRLVGQRRERGFEDGPVRDRRVGDLDRHRLDERHHGRLVDEAHLEVELGELGLAIAAQVLVAVAAGDLHVAVDAGDHQQLLELLRALRQGVDGPGLEPARDDEVAGALGRALDQGRRLDLDEPVRVVDLADRLDHPAAEHQAPLHRLPADVEVAVLEPQALVDGGVGLVDVEGRRLGLGQDLDVGRLELDRARRELRVLGPREAQRDRPSTVTTNSGRRRLAIACASGESVLSMTTWVSPCRSRRSRKISWP